MNNNNNNNNMNNNYPIHNKNNNISNIKTNLGNSTGYTPFNPGMGSSTTTSLSNPSSIQDGMKSNLSNVSMNVIPNTINGNKSIPSTTMYPSTTTGLSANGMNQKQLQTNIPSSYPNPVNGGPSYNNNNIIPNQNQFMTSNPSNSYSNPNINNNSYNVYPPQQTNSYQTGGPPPPMTQQSISSVPPMTMMRGSNVGNFSSHTMAPPPPPSNVPNMNMTNNRIPPQLNIDFSNMSLSNSSVPMYQTDMMPPQTSMMTGNHIPNNTPNTMYQQQQQQQQQQYNDHQISNINNNMISNAVLNEQLMKYKCNDSFMQLTIGTIPHSADYAQKSHLPFGVIVRPLASVNINEKENNSIDVVNFGQNGVIRCKRCRTYINPFVQWVDSGRRWRCNLCGSSNEVPSSYFCHLGPDQQRTDKEQRPELCKGSVEIIAPQEYMMRPPQPPVYVFVIDVSLNSIQSNMLAICVKTIKDNLDKLPGNPRTRIGFVTFDNAVHFYNLKAGLRTPQMMVVPDITELFIPIPDDLLVNLSDSRDVVDSLLDSLPILHQNTKNVDMALGPAIRAAFRVMSSIGGKMCIFQSGLPTLGQGSLKNRDNMRLLGTDKEHTLINAADTFYRQNAIEFCRQQVSVDMFLFSSQYTDVATLGSLSKFSAGQLYYYPDFQTNSKMVINKFQNDLTHCLTRETGWEAVMRVRCTQGMRLANYYGNSFLRGPDLLALPNVNSDSAFAIEIVHSDALLNAQAISIQAALLYTTSSGERRIRVHTLAASVTKIYAEVFRSANIDAVCNIIAKNALETCLKSGFDAARNKMQTKCCDIIRAYRNSGAYQQPYQAQSPNYSQLNLPDSLQLLPLYIMALMKNPAFRGGTDIRSDERTFLTYELNNMSVNQSRVFIYPRLYALHEMGEDCGLPIESNITNDIDINNIKLPPILNLSIERLSSQGILLLEDSIQIYLWIGRQAPAMYLKNLFNLDSLEGIDSNQLSICLNDATTDPLGKKIYNILNVLNKDKRMGMYIMKEGDPMEGRFFWKLVEDRASFNGGSYSYAEYLGLISRQSQGTMN